jgi:hypothetical protein
MAFHIGLWNDNYILLSKDERRKQSYPLAVFADAGGAPAGAAAVLPSVMKLETAICGLSARSGA